MNMMQHNGENGCLSCEEPGTVVSVGRGHARYYPFRACGEEAQKRTTETFLANALEAHESGKRVYSSLTFMIYTYCNTQPVFSFVPQGLHSIT